MSGRNTILGNAVAKLSSYGAPARATARTTCPGEDDPLLDWSDEGTEVLGGLLWAAFARGCDPCPFGIDVIEKGRELSRCWVRHNYVTHGDQFPLTQTLDCAYDCGNEARKLAGAGNAITAQHFADAWDRVKNGRAMALARLQRMSASSGQDEYEFLAGGCG